MSKDKDSRPSRRKTLLGDRPGSFAIARQVRISATKSRRVVDLVRGMDVADALDTLKFAPQAASGDLAVRRPATQTGSLRPVSSTLGERAGLRRAKNGSKSPAKMVCATLAVLRPFPGATQMAPSVSSSSAILE